MSSTRAERAINPFWEIISSRNVEARIECLEARGKRQRDANENDELRALISLRKQCERYPDWRHGATLINDRYFVQYAKEFAEEVGALDRRMTWPYDHIDWEAAAEALKLNYADVDFGGQTFWVIAS